MHCRSDKFPMERRDWPGLKLKGQIFYEMHIGTFTREGTWRAAAEQLPSWRRIGITVDRNHAGVAEFPREIWLGLRRGRPVRALTLIRNAGRVRGHVSLTAPTR
jgi:hypothetical protein